MLSNKTLLSIFRQPDQGGPPAARVRQQDRHPDRRLPAGAVVRGPGRPPQHVHRRDGDHGHRRLHAVRVRGREGRAGEDDTRRGEVPLGRELAVQDGTGLRQHYGSRVQIRGYVGRTRRQGKFLAKLAGADEVFLISQP